MGWLTVMYALQLIDQRERGGREALRRALHGEADPARTLWVGMREFESRYGRPPRYMKPSAGEPAVQR